MWKRQLRHRRRASDAFDFFPTGLLLNAGPPANLRCQIQAHGACFFGSFNFDAQAKTIRCLDITEEFQSAPLDARWIALCGGHLRRFNPEAPCARKSDRRRFANNASMLFHKLRELLVDGRALIPASRLVAGIRCRFDGQGRYIITNYREKPQACLCALACSPLAQV